MSFERNLSLFLFLLLSLSLLIPLSFSFFLTHILYLATTHFVWTSYAIRSTGYPHKGEATEL